MDGLHGAATISVTLSDNTVYAIIIDRNGMGSAVANYNGDGDLVLFVTGIFGGTEAVGHRLYQYSGDGTLQVVTVTASVADGIW
jgi:hypothetical protein